MNDTTLPSDNPKQKIQQNKPQYNLDRQTANILASFLAGEDNLLENNLLEKAVAIKRFEYCE